MPSPCGVAKGAWLLKPGTDKTLGEMWGIGSKSLPAPSKDGEVIVIKTIIVSLIYVVLKQNHYKAWVYHAVALMSVFPVLWNGLQIVKLFIVSAGI